MNKISVIGITGYKRSGKDTVGKIIKQYCNQQGYKCRKYMLADLIKRTLCKLTGLSITGLENIKDDNIIEDPSFTYRDALIAFADRYKGKHGKEVHYNYTKDQILKNQPDIAIITDIRYPFETELFRGDFNTKIIRVIRPGIKVDNSHSSETSIDDIDPDYIIVNDNDIDVLKNKVHELLNQIHLPTR